MVDATPPLLECRAISKHFGGAVALDEVDFAIRAGEVHGIVGSNGAGKSTLMKILAGALPDHEGEIIWQGRPVKLPSPQAALKQGIAMVYQELSGIGPLSVAENLVLGRQNLTRLGLVDWAAIRRQARAYLAELDIDVDVTARLDRYPLVVRQMVEIARGLHSGARLLILDEPTSALSPPETRRLFELVRRLKQRGVAVVFISHFLEDVLQICDQVTILRDGRRIATRASGELDKHAVIQAMLGHRLEGFEPGFEGLTALPPRTSRPARLKVSALGLPGAFEAVTFEVAAGECLGLFGFVGAGHQELAHALAGALRPTAGEVLVDQRPLRSGSVYAAVRRGVVLVAADRGQTLVPRAEIFKNVTLAHLRSAIGDWLALRRELAVTAPLLARVGCRPANSRLPVGSLSGGNQQKVVIAKWLLGQVRVLVLEEPTRGMDVAAKEEIMRLVDELRRQGSAVILSTSEPEMVLAHCQRILVFKRGRIAREYADCQLDKADLLRQA